MSPSSQQQQGSALGLHRTDMTTFLGSVGAELRRASEFLGRSQPVGALPLAPPSSPLAPLHVEEAAHGEVVARRADRREESELAAQLTVLLPEPGQVPQAAQAGTPAAVAAAAGNREPPVVPQSLGTTESAPKPPSAVQHSLAKVMSWLSACSEATANPACSELINSDLSAGGAVPSARQPTAPLAANRGWGKQPQPQLRQPRAALAPPCQSVPTYVAQLPPPWTQRKLVLARPPCRGCGRAEAECHCSSAAAYTLRLLRPRHPSQPSPAMQSRQHPVARQAVPQAASAVPLIPQQGSTISIGSIQTAHFGGCNVPSGPPTWPEQPTGAGSSACGLPTSHALAPCTGATPTPSGRELDVWRAYLESRKRQGEAGGKEAPCADDGGGSGGGGALTQLRAISRRIQGLQGNIAGFLLEQQHLPGSLKGQGCAHAAAAAAAIAALSTHSAVPSGALCGGALGCRQLNGQPDQAAVLTQLSAPTMTKQPPGMPTDPGMCQNTCKGLAAAAPRPAAPAPGERELFSDDFILSMKIGTDFRRLQRGPTVAGAGQGGSTGAAVTAERVGRQSRAGRRFPVAV